jgi:hypothetical protein
MVGVKRYFLVITKNKSSVVLECPDLLMLNNFESRAAANGAVCKHITIEEFYPTYRGYRYFDFRNPITVKTFSIDEILEILDTPLEDHGEVEDIFGGNIFH